MTRVQRWQKTSLSWEEAGYDSDELDVNDPPVVHEMDKKDGGHSVQCVSLD